MRATIAAAAPLLLLLPLPGCVSFLPSYDAAIFAKMDGAVTDLERVRAAVAVPYDPAPGFDDVEPLYISALGGVIAAEKIAAGRAGPVDSVRGRPAQEAAGLVAGAIRTCRTAIETMMRRHQRGGRIDAQTFDDSLLIDTCAIPRVMEARLNR